MEIPRSLICDYDIDLAAGDAEIIGVSAEKMDVDLAAGNLYLKESTVSNKLDLDLAAGSAEITGTSLNILNGDLAVGSIKCEILDDIDNYDLDIEAALGSIRIRGEEMGGLYTSKKTKKGNSKTIKLSLALGDVELI